MSSERDDNMRQVASAEPWQRAVLVDDPSRAIAITVYAGDGRAAAVPLSPVRALVLADELLRAATRRLA
jgi:hypothetical protein